MATFRDPLFASQWHFRLLGDIGTIWDDYSGAGITVGVYDDGLQYAHPDLSDNYDSSLHFEYGGVALDPTPIDTDDGHGTSVAGLIAAAAGNGIGGVGVAWGASLTGVAFLSDPVLEFQSVFLDSYRYAANFDIMSNSWGYGAFFDDTLNRSDAESEGALTVAAFSHAVDTGRDGLGTAIVKSAGNDATNANGEGINGSRYVTNVAAIGENGSVTSYSNFGTNILVAAAEASITTDLTGRDGYTTSDGTAGDYTNTFGGTSAAAPLVSGVVALMFEANPNLGWRDVREVLATSAALTGSGIGRASGFEVEGFTSQGSGTWNGGGHAISRDYGYGRVDAFAAVRMAEVWQLWTAVPKTSGNEQHVHVSTPENYSVPAFNGSAQPYLDVPTHLLIEHIDVTISFSFPPFLYINEENVDFALIAPNGTRFAFFRSADGNIDENGTWDTSGGFTWTFGIAHALGMVSEGRWVLEVSGRVNGANIGNITDFSLDFYGSLPAPVGNDVHHITKDFLTITGAGSSNWNGGRDRVLADENGGDDWINLSSIAGNVDLSLAESGSLRVGGALWAALADGGQFENVVTGDGADRIQGNANANMLQGMRGNDQLQGLDGDDTIDGGAGDDRLLGGLANDAINGGTGRNDLFGGAGDDVLNGENGWGMLRGEAGNDRLTGGNGADRMDGGAGNDTLTGDAGRDLLTGGIGADVFVFNTGFGHDQITDFADNIDTLAFAASFWTGPGGAQQFVDTFAQILRGYALFAFEDGNTLQVTGVGTLAQLYDDVTFI